MIDCIVPHPLTAHYSVPPQIVIFEVPPDLPKGIRKLELKMAKGGISAPNIHLAKDLKFSYETLFNSWIYKNPQKAKERYEHLSLIIRNECQQAYDEVYKQDELFGRDMLIDVRKRLRERLKNESALFFNCTYEHLLGVAGVLTELCQVWWSEGFEIPEGGEP